MKFYQIILPVNDNSGKDLLRAHLAFQQGVTDLVGGYTRLRQSYGAWNNTEDETVEEKVIPYQIAAEESAWPKVVALAVSLFEDQQAIFYAELGTATIVERQQLVA